MLLTNDKHQVVNWIKRSIDDDNINSGDKINGTDDIPPVETSSNSLIEDVVSISKVIILDGMAVVNALPEDSKDTVSVIRTCDDLAELFIAQLGSICSEYNEVRLMFDRYIHNSLKSKTRDERSKGKTSTHYRINDQTVIKNILLKELLSNIRTKSELTSYLAGKVLAHSKSHSNRFKMFMVTYQTYTLGNIDDHKEADTLY